MFGTGGGSSAKSRWSNNKYEAQRIAANIAKLPGCSHSISAYAAVQGVRRIAFNQPTVIAVMRRVPLDTVIDFEVHWSRRCA